MTKTQLLRSLAAVGAGLALAAGGVIVTAGPASADTPGCVTKSEYRKVHKGMTKKRVHRIFDNRGHRQAFAQSGGHTAEIRGYRTCSPFSAIAVSYGDGRLDAKSAVWVS
jgi:hypothetical protein